MFPGTWNLSSEPCYRSALFPEFLAYQFSYMYFYGFGLHKKSVNFVNRCTWHLRISGLPNQSKYTNNSSRITRERFEHCSWLVLESVQFSNVKICFKRYIYNMLYFSFSYFFCFYIFKYQRSKVNEKNNNRSMTK